MDLATHILRLRHYSPGQWAQTANSYLAPAVSVVLILALAYQLAKLTWALVPGAPVDAPPPVVNPGSAELSEPHTQAVDIARIIGSHLFGEISAEPVAPVTVSVLQAPDTTLNLLLKATVSDARADSRGAAIIASGNVEKTYTVADVIDGTGGAQLHAIYNDRVILIRAGQLETLRLPREYATGSGVVYPSPIATPVPQTPSLRSVLSENASRITDVVRVAPHIEQGRMVGFRLNPGREPQQFQALGFQPGDVVTEINGTAMSDPSRGLQVFESLGESTVANVTVVRDGTPQVLTIDTTQLDELTYDR